MHTLEFKNIIVEREGPNPSEHGRAGKTVVDEVSLSVKSGEVHVIMGPNGSGKSTLLNAVMGHPAYKVLGGTIALDGEDITMLPTEGKAEKGIILSMQYLPAIDGVTMITFLHRAYRLLKSTEISILDFNRMLVEKVRAAGLDEGLLKRFVNVGFSGGEKKQAEIMQLLVLEPTFALLDEIDSGVDVDSLGKVFGTIETMRKNGTGFIVVTHSGAILEKITPDRVSVMKGGKIVRSGGVELAREILSKGFEGNS